MQRKPLLKTSRLNRLAPFSNAWSRGLARKRGSVLATAYFLSIIAALTTLWLAQTIMDHERLNTRGRRLSQALFAAEAGVAQVIHWGNYPADYDSDQSTGLFYRDPATHEFPNLAPDAFTQNITVSADKLHEMVSDSGVRIAEIAELVLIPPDPANDPVPCLLKVRATGESREVRRQVLAYLNPSPLATSSVTVPAGLISLAEAAQVGNGRVHWGESWSKENFSMLTKPQSTYLDMTEDEYDPFARYRTEGLLLFPSGGWKVYDPARPSKAGDIHDVTTARYPGSEPATGNFENAFEQLIPPGTLDWPDFLSEYETFKDQAIAHGRYYSTDEDGNIYRDGIEDADHLIDFDDEFGDADRETSPYDLVFIDTMDGQPPAEDGSNLATINNSGYNEGMKGIFWIGANYDQAGTGVPEPLESAEKPILHEDGTVTYQPTTLPEPDAGNGNFGVYLDGVIYTAGTAHFQGSPVIYGSVVAEKGYLSGGTPEIYYNHKLATGLEIPHGNVGSVLHIAMQRNNGCPQGD